MKIIDRKFLDTTTKTCHASTLAFHRGEPCFAWFGGSREGLPDSSIYVQYKGKIKSLGERVQMAFWNPVLFTIKDELFLSYKIGEFCDRWNGYLLNITDIEEIKDLNKVKKQIIPAGLNFCVKTKPLYLKEINELVCGSSVETRFDWASYIESYSYVNGKFEFLERSQPLTTEKKVYEYESQYYGKVRQLTLGLIQPALWVDKDSVKHAFFRSSRGLGQIYYSKEVNNIWLDPIPIKHKNPNASVDVVYFDGRLFLVYNPSKELRAPLVINELDEEFLVVDEIVVQDETKGKTYTKELSYPYMALGSDNNLHLTYTYGRSSIEYVEVEI